MNFSSSQKPLRGENESALAYAYRVAQWEQEYKAIAIVEARKADKLAQKPKYRVNPIPTRETERERISLYEKAETNPLLRSVLRARQRA